MNLLKLNNKNPAHQKIISAALDSYMCDFETDEQLHYQVLSQYPTGPDVWAFGNVHKGAVVIAVITEPQWESNVFYLVNSLDHDYHMPIKGI
jgi:hypothetical protein